MSDSPADIIAAFKAMGAAKDRQLEQNSNQVPDPQHTAAIRPFELNGGK